MKKQTIEQKYKKSLYKKQWDKNNREKMKEYSQNRYNNNKQAHLMFCTLNALLNPTAYKKCIKKYQDKRRLSPETRPDYLKYRAEWFAKNKLAIQIQRDLKAITKFKKLK